MQEMVLNTATPEVYSVGAPTIYGTWQWKGSDDGLSWTSVGDPWFFRDACYFMVAPSPDYYFGDSFIPSEFKFWRMELVSGTAFAGNPHLQQFIFNLIDSGNYVTEFSAGFTDGTDDALSSAEIDLGEPAPADEISFSDDVGDAFIGTLTVITNYSLSATFSDDENDAFEIVSDIFPSSFPQVHVYSTGRS
jgi:hypothetical protein